MPFRNSRVTPRLEIADRDEVLFLVFLGHAKREPTAAGQAYTTVFEFAQIAS
jgi:hypothetical protein